MTTQPQTAEAPATKAPTLQGALTATRTMTNLMSGRLDAQTARAAADVILAAAGSEGAALRALAGAFPEVLGSQAEAIGAAAQRLDEDEHEVVTVVDPVSGETEELLGFVDFAEYLLGGELNALTIMRGVSESAISDTLEGGGWDQLRTEFLGADADPEDWLPMCQDLPEGVIVLPLGADYGAAAAAVYNNQVLDLINAEVEAVSFDTPGAGAMLRRWSGMLSDPVHGVDDSYRSQLQRSIERVLSAEDGE